MGHFLDLFRRHSGCVRAADKRADRGAGNKIYRDIVLA
jgi:hypothetical protein